jgi:cytochrome c oxidase cbb3-type subunit 3
MSDFVSDFWGIWITAIVVAGFVGLSLLLFTQSKTTVKKGEQVETMGTYGMATSKSTTTRCRAGGC